MRIRSDWLWVSVVWLCLILAFWGFIGALILPAIFYGRDLSRDYLLWSVGWIVMVVWICYVSRDYLVTETLVLAGDVLTLNRNYLIFTSTESFRADEVENLRAAGIDDGTVEFEVGDRTYYLRNRLNGRDAQRVVEELRVRIGTTATP
jgi:hypothetical protein